MTNKYDASEKERERERGGGRGVGERWHLGERGKTGEIRGPSKSYWHTLGTQTAPPHPLNSSRVIFFFNCAPMPF